MTILAFDTETLKLASEVAEGHADELGGASPWSRPDLFGFGVGVAVDLGTNVAFRHRSPEAMIEHLREAAVTVGYNTAAFDLDVLGAYGDVSAIGEKHVDLNLLIREGLDALPEAQQPGVDRLRQGGLNGLAKANGLGGKTGSGIHAPELLRAGKVEEVMNYCEADARLVAELYRRAREQGELKVEAHYHDEQDGERTYLPMPVFVPLAL